MKAELRISFKDYHSNKKSEDPAVPAAVSVEGVPGADEWSVLAEGRWADLPDPTDEGGAQGVGGGSRS